MTRLGSTKKCRKIHCLDLSHHPVYRVEFSNLTSESIFRPKTWVYKEMLYDSAIWWLQIWYETYLVHMRNTTHISVHTRNTSYISVHTRNDWDLQNWSLEIAESYNDLVTHEHARSDGYETWFAWDMIDSYETWLIHKRHDSYEIWFAWDMMHMRYDWLIWGLIEMRHDWFIWNMIDLRPDSYEK